MTYAMLVIVNSDDPIAAFDTIADSTAADQLAFVGTPWPVVPLPHPPDEDPVFSSGHCVRQLLEQKMGI